VRLDELDHIRAPVEFQDISILLRIYRGEASPGDLERREKAYEYVVNKVAQILSKSFPNLGYDEVTLEWSSMMDPMEILECLVNSIVPRGETNSLDPTRDIANPLGYTELSIRRCGSCHQTKCEPANPRMAITLTSPTKVIPRQVYTCEELLPHHALAEESMCSICFAQAASTQQVYRNPSPNIIVGSPRFGVAFGLKTPFNLVIPFDGVTSSVAYRLHFVMTFARQHYVAYVLRGGEWFCFNEEKCLKAPVAWHTAIEKTGVWYGFSQAAV